MNRGRSLLVLVSAGWFGGCRSTESGPLVARGTVEVPEIDLSAPVPARLVSVRVEEGALVRAGDTIAVLSQAELPSSLDAQRARVANTQARLRDLEAGARPAELERAQAEVAAARAETQRASKDAERMRSLAAQDVISKQQLDQAETAARVAAERQRAAEEALALLRAGSRRDQIAAARAELANARASLGQIEARAGDLVLVAPRPGRVLSRQAEPGEFLAAGVPAVTLGEVGRPYVRVYVPASRLGEVRLGDTARVTVGDPAKRAKEPASNDPTTLARVVAISPKAEFTPRVALTEQERADLMFGVKLDLLPPFESLHPGMWIRAEFGPDRARTKEQVSK
jgi:HlyD family secretion protein